MRARIDEALGEPDFELLCGGYETNYYGDTEDGAWVAQIVLPTESEDEILTDDSIKQLMRRVAEWTDKNPQPGSLAAQLAAANARIAALETHVELLKEQRARYWREMPAVIRAYGRVRKIAEHWRGVANGEV